MHQSTDKTRGAPRRNFMQRGPTRAPRKKIRRWTLVAWAVAILVVIGAIVGLVMSGDYSLKDITEAISKLNPVMVITLMALLPLFGFSISIVYLVVGARFGPIAGIPVVIGVTAFHLIATYWMTRSFLRKPLENFLAKRGYHLPKVLPGEYAEVCVLGTLVPGPPYFVRNYLLALTGAPFRTYVGVCLIVHVVRSYVAILVGDLAGNPDRKELIIIAGVYAVKLTVCALIVWRLRRHRHPKTQAHA
jgi:uncharacterized membrane protein YdjX (TVP38/TMEM64 family)